MNFFPFVLVLSLATCVFFLLMPKRVCMLLGLLLSFWKKCCDIFSKFTYERQHFVMFAEESLTMVVLLAGDE